MDSAQTDTQGSDLAYLFCIFSFYMCAGRKFVLHYTLVDMPRIDIFCEHTLAVCGQQGISVSQFRKKRDTAFCFDGAKQRFGTFAEAKYACIIDIVFRLVGGKILLPHP